MSNLRIGIASRSLQRPLRKCLEAVSRLGADGLEIDLRSELPAADLGPSAIRQLRKLLGDHRLTLAAAVFPTRRGFAHADQLDRRVSAARTAIAAAGKLGAGTLVIYPGQVPHEGEPAREVFVESLRSLARHADHHGVCLALQAGSDNWEDLAELLPALPDTTVGVCLNPAALLAGGCESAEAVERIGTRLAHLYAADAVRDLSTHGAVDVELGRGSVEWPDLLGRLESHHYQGWLVVSRRNEAGMEELENAVAYLRTV